MSYPLITVFIFLGALLMGGIALIADAGIRMLRGQWR
jgi:hypothetical protein